MPTSHPLAFSYTSCLGKLKVPLSAPLIPTHGCEDAQNTSVSFNGDMLTPSSWGQG